MITRAFAALWAHKLSSGLTILGVAVCVFTLATTDGMLGWMYASRAPDWARFHGKLLIQQALAGYPPFNSLLPESLANAILQQSDVMELSTPILLAVLEPPDNPMDRARLVGVGIRPGKERAYVTDASVVRGKLELDSDDAVVLGSEAASFYGTRMPGETLTLRRNTWRVVGILAPTLSKNVDRAILMPLASAQSEFGAAGFVSAVLVSTRDPSRAAARLAVAFPALDIVSEEDVQGYLDKEVEFPARYLGTLTLVAFIVAAILIAAIMLLAIRERAREIATVQAIGAERRVILAHTLTEALTLSIGGGIIGIAVAFPATYALGWPWILPPDEMLRLAGLVLIAGILAGIYPAYQAARAYPEALRVEELRARLQQVSADKQTLGQAYRQLVVGREEERKRIARDLHDQVVQNLLGLKFHLADQVAGQSPLQGEINTTIETIRHLCADLRPPALDHLGLAAALRSYAQDFQARTNLAVELQLDDTAHLSEEIALALFRVMQEALTNAWRHARAQRVRVTLKSSRDAVELSVHDDGSGFQVPEHIGALVEQGHFGLMSMRERVELVGGTLQLDSQPGRGTCVEARVPIVDK
jgi:signal transduction histidine kinase